MFKGAASFNQTLDTWVVTKVKSMCFMFSGATSFNQPLDKWDVADVTRMKSMFDGAAAFNQPTFLRRCVRPCTLTHANESQRMHVHMDRSGPALCCIAHSGSAASLPVAATFTLHARAGGVGKAELANRGAAEGVVRASRPAHDRRKAGAGGTAGAAARVHVDRP